VGSYTKQTWTDLDPTTPISGARLTHLESQYDAAMADVAAAYAKKPLDQGVIYVAVSGNDSFDGLTMGTAKATLAGAVAAIGTSSGRIVMGTGNIPGGSGVVFPAGFKASVVGQGQSETTVVMTAQSGPALDFRSVGYSFDGSEVGDFGILGDGVANSANKGIAFSPTTSNSKLFVHDIIVSNTGGPCFDFGNLELCDLTRLYAKEPVSAAASNIAYVTATGAFNGNTIDGLQLYGVSSGANVGASGAVIIKDNGSTAPHDNHFRTAKTENLHLASGATIFAIAGNTNIISDTEFFDWQKVSGATGTSYIRFTVPGGGVNTGGNVVLGVIPGKGTGATDLDMGIDMRQSGNRVIGTKGYRGTNVIIASGITGIDVDLGGAVSGATDPAVIDNSGSSFKNTLRDASLGVFAGSSLGPRRFFSGRWYGPANHNLGTLNAVLNQEYAVPIYVPNTITVSALAIDLVTVLASSSVRLGVYANDTSRDCPGTLLLDAGTVNTATSTGIQSITGLSLTLTPGLYWLAATAQGAGPVPVRGITGSLDPVAPTSLLSTTAEINCYYLNSISGALANWSAGALASTINGPKIMLLVS